LRIFALGWLVAVLYQQALAGHPTGWLMVYACGFPFTLFLISAEDVVPDVSEPAMMYCPAVPDHSSRSRPLVSLVKTASGPTLRWRGGRTFTGVCLATVKSCVWSCESAQALTSERMINRVLVAGADRAAGTCR
jgi:hypothetical protein